MGTLNVVALVILYQMLSSQDNQSSGTVKTAISILLPFSIIGMIITAILQFTTTIILVVWTIYLFW